MSKSGKKRHHYVPKFYLKGWTKEGKVWCLDKQSNRIFETSPENIGVGKFFYRVENFTENDKDLLEKIFLDESDSFEVHLFIRTLLTHFLMCINLRRAAENDKEILKFLSRIFDSNIDNLYKICINVEEDFYSRIEDLAAPQLRKLKAIPLEEFKTIYSTRQTLDFDLLLCLCSQYFRTPRIRSILNKIGNDRIDKSLRKKVVEELQPLVSIVLSIKLAFNLWKAIKDGTVRISLLINKTEVPFITGDQPVLNLQADYTSSTEVDKLELFFPLSPDRSLLIKDSDPTLEVVKEIESESEIKQLNKKIYEAAERQVYSNQKEVLENPL